MSQKASGKHRTATIMFVDLIGSSDAASYVGLGDYTKYLEAFKGTLLKAWEDLEIENEPKGIKENIRKKEITGDQGFFLFASKWEAEDYEREEKGYLREDIFEIFRLALRIKYTWQMQEKNIEKIENSKKPFEIAIGINTGIISIENKENELGELELTTEGYSINLAKRIEGESRKGTYSKIFVGETTYGIYSDSPGENPIRFNKQELAPLKGIAGDIRIYEITYTALEEDENSILTIPQEWKKPKSQRLRESLCKDLMEIRKYSSATQDPWLINLYCNVKWAQIQQKIDDGQPFEKDDYSDVIEMARKLVELDKYFSAWKVYMGQMILDYFKYSLKKTKIRDNIVLLRDTIEILKTLTSNEPYELDARLTLGRFYLESTGLDKDTLGTLIGKDESAKEMAVEQFRRIMVWDDEYEDAYYYCAPALVSNDLRERLAAHAGIENRAIDRGNLKEAESCIDRLYDLLTERDESKDRMKKIFEDAKRDPLFKKLNDKLETILRKIDKHKK